MFCCFRPPATQEGHTADGTGGLVKPDTADAAGGSEPPRRRSGSSSGANQFQAQQQQQQNTQQKQQLGQVPLEPLARLGEGAAQQAPGLQPAASHAAASGHAAAAHHAQQQQQQQAVATQQQSRPSEDAGQAPQGDVLQLVALLQELLGLSTASPKQPLSKAMGLLVVRLPVDWACLHVFSASGRVVMQVGAALSPEAQRQRGASGSCSYATPVGTTPVRQRTSFSNMLNAAAGSGSSASGAAGAGAAGSAPVQEVGAGHLAVLLGSGSSLELVSASRQALAMYAADEAQAAALPPDWQRLYADRDLRSFLAVPIIASGSAGSIIGALSFGLTSITDWGLAWWMSSIQLLCGWAAGALPQNRSTARASFFDALWGAGSLQELGRVFVQQLPAAMADQAQHKLEARLALVSSRVASCVMFAGAPDSRTSQEQQLPAGGQQQQAPQQDHQQQLQQQQQQHAAVMQQQPPLGRAPSPAGKDGLPEGMILTAADDTSIDILGWQQQAADSHRSSSSKASRELGQAQSHSQQQQQEQQDGTAAAAAAAAAAQEQVSRFTLPTANSVLLSALEWGEVMVVKDTVTYFGRNAAGGSSAVRDLFLPDRPMVRGTLVLLPLVYRCRAMGCVYLLAPWDIHAELGKAALQEAAALLASGTFKALLSGGHVQADWYREVLSEGPMPSGPMPSVPELESSSSTAAAEAAAAAAAAAAKLPSPAPAATAAASGSAVTAPLAQADRPVPAAAALSAVEHRSERSQSPMGGPEGWGSGEGAGALGLGGAGSVDSMDKSSGAAGTAAGAAGAGTSNGSNAVSCPLPLSTAEAVIAATAAAQSAAAAAAAIAPVGLPVCGHAASGFASLVLWPELLDIKADLARSRHTAVYTAEYGGHLLAVKLFRYSTSMDYAAGSHPSQLHGGPGGGAAAAAAGISSLLGHHGTSSSSGGNVASEAELEAVLSLQYRLCNMSHQHLLQHVAVYPRVFEVVQRRSSREPPDVYLAAMLPRKERHHRCAALVTEHAPGGCLRDAVNRGQVHVPTPATLQAAAAALGWAGPVDVAGLAPGQLQELLGQVAQQLPLMQQQPSAARTSHDYALQGQAGGGALGRLQQPGVVSAPLPPPLSLPGRPSVELQQLRQPHMQLLRQLLLHVALGMQHLHAHGIIHGELRLDNVMISGDLPSTASLLQQQQQQQQQAAAGGESLLAAAAPAAAVVAATGGPADAELAGRSNSSGGSAGGVVDGALGGGSSSSGGRVPPGRSGSSSSAGAAGGGGVDAGFQGFLLKLKDIGLCTLGYSNRQCTLRKLAGRARLQSVSWLAPECFRGEGLSKHSDVYAFGILMWELYTGEVAFNDLVTSNTKVLQTIIGDGVRPQFPDSAPAWYVNLASRCWAGAPKSRPSFRRIVQALSALDADPAAAAVVGAAAGPRG